MVRGFRSLCLSLINLVDKLHGRNIVFNDLSPNNVIAVAGGSELRLVDFEGAHQIGVDRPTNVYTPGFVSRSRLSGGAGNFAEDYYGIGSVLLAYLLPVNQLFHLNPKAKDDFLESVQSEISIPRSVIDMLLQLTGQDAQKRPSLAQMRATLENAVAP